MKEYLLIFRGGRTPEADRSPENAARDMERWKDWMSGLAQDGKLIGGQPLTGDGKVMSAKGSSITDGPFAEGKEVVNGYVMIKAADYNEATSLSKGCPIFDYDGTIELREVAKMDM